MRLLNHVCKLANLASAVIVNSRSRLHGFKSIRKLSLCLSETEGGCVILTQIFTKYIFVVSLWLFTLVSEGRRGLRNPAVSRTSVFVSSLLWIHQIRRRLVNWQLCLLSYWSHSTTYFVFVLLTCLWSLGCGVVFQAVHHPPVCVTPQRAVATSQAYYQVRLTDTSSTLVLKSVLTLFVMPNLTIRRLF